MINRNGFLSGFLGILFIIIIVSFFVPTTSMIMAPGIAQELSPMITVENGYKNKSQGDFMLTAVSTQRATLWDYLYITIKHPIGVELEPLSEHLPEGMSMDEYLNIMQKFMEDSKNKAKAVAFKMAGYQIDVKHNGVFIEEVLKNGSAEGKLEAGDIIIAVDDQEVKEDQDAIDLIREHQIGEEVKITIKRGDEILDYTMETVELANTADDPKPSIGVMIYSNIDYEFPREVTFHTENIAGSSAGGMFALEIYNQLLQEDITHGRRIAGTGTIDLEGKIGPIDGVEQKVITAERNNAVLFFVPVDNYEAAKKTATSIELVSIETIDDAINYLEKN